MPLLDISIRTHAIPCCPLLIPYGLGCHMSESFDGFDLIVGPSEVI